MGVFDGDGVAGLLFVFSGEGGIEGGVEFAGGVVGDVVEGDVGERGGTGGGEEAGGDKTESDDGEELERHENLCVNQMCKFRIGLDENNARGAGLSTTTGHERLHDSTPQAAGGLPMVSSERAVSMEKTYYSYSFSMC